MENLVSIFIICKSSTGQQTILEHPTKRNSNFILITANEKETCFRIQIDTNSFLVFPALVSNLPPIERNLSDLDLTRIKKNEKYQNTSCNFFLIFEFKSLLDTNAKLFMKNILTPLGRILLKEELKSKFVESEVDKIITRQSNELQLFIKSAFTSLRQEGIIESRLNDSSHVSLNLNCQNIQAEEFHAVLLVKDKRYILEKSSPSRRVLIEEIISSFNPFTSLKMISIDLKKEYCEIIKIVAQMQRRNQIRLIPAIRSDSILRVIDKDITEFKRIDGRSLLDIQSDGITLDRVAELYNNFKLVQIHRFFIIFVEKVQEPRKLNYPLVAARVCNRKHAEVFWMLMKYFDGKTPDYFILHKENITRDVLDLCITSFSDIVITFQSDDLFSSDP